MHWLLPVVGAACVASLVGFGAMLQDKRRAARRVWRTRERTLVLLAVAGGWPGLLAGGILVRHKTRASRFKAKVAVGAVLHLAVVAFVVMAVTH